jgi:hypothetical protein
MTEWCGCHQTYRQHADIVNRFIEYARKKAMDNTHAALLIMALHRLNGLLVEKEDDGTTSAVVLSHSNLVVFTVRRNLIVTFHVREREERGPKIAMGLIPFLEGHLAAIHANVEPRPGARERVLRVDVWSEERGPPPHKDLAFEWIDNRAAVSVSLLLTALLRALEANAAHVSAIAEFLPVNLLPELAGEYAYMTGDSLLQEALAKVPRQRTLLSYFKKRRTQ